METEGSRTVQENNPNQNDTIVACATPPGTGAIGIIKISGPESLFILGKLFKPRIKKEIHQYENFRLYLGDVTNPQTGQVIDEALAVVMRAPHSYTREDVVELQFHGGLFLAHRILSLVIDNGALPAPPGEFTRRAFLKGRIDLTQAEAISQIIRARSDKALEISHRILQGELGKLLSSWRERIIRLQATLEAWIDFHDQETVGHFEPSISQELTVLISEISKELSRSDQYKTVQNGYRVIITGKPNVGKSKLFNSLISQQRAIVTEVAGTTRDVIEESIYLDGTLISFADTAGIRKTEDPIECLGMEKAREYLDQADLVLAVIDQNSEYTADDRAVAELVRGKRLMIVLNKQDLAKYTSKDILYSQFDTHEAIEVSALTGQGIPELIREISHKASSAIDHEETALIVTTRQKVLLQTAFDVLILAQKNSNNGFPIDMVSFDLAEASRSLGKISGETYDSNVEETLFSTFCIGK